MAITKEIFRPCFWKEGHLGAPIFLPRPILTCSVPFRWDTRKQKLPMRAGALVDAPSLDAITISISGVLAVDVAVDEEEGPYNKEIVSEEEMWNKVTQVANFINVTDDERLEFFLYYDPTGGGEYRKLVGVVPDLFEPNIGDTSGNLWGYSMTLYCPNPTIYNTAPGV